MSFGFQSSSALLWSDDGHNFTLAEPLTYKTQAGELITIPEGATSDGASIPRFLWRLLPPFGEYWKAALLHDYLYRATDRPKKECDWLLKEASVSCGVPKWKAQLLYNGVALFGGPAFRANRKKTQP